MTAIIESGKTYVRKVGFQNRREIISNSPQETVRIAEKLADLLDGGMVVALFGELGSGKTTFIKGICQGLDVVDDVTSPTFTLIHEYSGRLPVYHCDFYRIESPKEIVELGCEELFSGDGVCLIEWADRIHAYLPQHRIEVYLKSRFGEGRENLREILIKSL